MSEIQDFDVLLIGFTNELLASMQQLLAPLRVKHLSEGKDVEVFLETFQMEAGSVVFVSSETKELSHLEVAQALSSYYQGVLQYFVTSDRTKFEVKNLKKNGFSEVVLLPGDQKVLDECIVNVKMQKGKGPKKKFKAVKLVDLQPGLDLPFDVRTYLPLNNKYVLLTASGKLSDKKFNTLKDKVVNSVFIDAQQQKEFYSFAAEQLVKLGQAPSGGGTNTDRAERLQASVRSLFQSVMDTSTSSDFQLGRDLLEQSKKVVESFVEKKIGVNLGAKLKELLGEGRDTYSHAQVVSTIACLLSMATEIGKPEDLAIAGLFHDISVQVREDLNIFNLDQATEEERKAYLQHPLGSLNLLKEKKITITPQIGEMIEKHHERPDGKGFPKGVAGNRIPAEAQLLAYADAFEYLSRPKAGEEAMSMTEIHNFINEKLGLNPEVMMKVKKFLSSFEAKQSLAG